MATQGYKTTESVFVNIAVVVCLSVWVSCLEIAEFQDGVRWSALTVSVSYDGPGKRRDDYRHVLKDRRSMVSCRIQRRR